MKSMPGRSTIVYGRTVEAAILELTMT